MSKLLVIRALAEHAQLDAKIIAQRMMGYTDKTMRPEPVRYRALIARDDAGAVAAHPFPFFLAHPLQIPLAEFERELGTPADWQIEWKYDGIRAQLVRRDGRSWLWSRGEELIGEAFPDVIDAFAGLDDGTVLDGELVIWREDRPAPFAQLQRRIARKRLTAKLLQDAPARLIAFDLIEFGGADWRGRPQHERRAALEALAVRHGFTVAPLVAGSSWDELARLRGESRVRAVEGLMLKHRDAIYRVGRTRDPGGAHWWKWKIDPYAVDAVLVYAQPGHGRRASLFTDYTFAVWDRAPHDAAEAQAYVGALLAGESPAEAQARGLPVLVPFAKAYSGLTDAEIRQVDATVRHSTIERFGPVRSVVPAMVFELGFEGIQRSPRHRSGIAVRFPRMLRWRSDKPLHEADTLAVLEGLLEPGRAARPGWSADDAADSRLPEDASTGMSRRRPRYRGGGCTLPRQPANQWRPTFALSRVNCALLCLTAKRFSISWRRADETHHRCCCHAALRGRCVGLPLPGRHEEDRRRAGQEPQAD